MKAPKGTYDILPDQINKWHYLEKVLHECARRFAYKEIRTPIFEHSELFIRGVGESSDIVSKEMYTFPDRSEQKRSLTLRPEGTASSVRALVEGKEYNKLMPVKWYYLGPMFRYSRPQTGRYRQFHQFGAEAFGGNSPYMDAEAVMLLAFILESAGLLQFDLHLNSVGCPECRAAYREALLDHFQPRRDQLCPDCQTRIKQNPLRVIDCKEEECQKAIDGYPHLIDHLCQPCAIHYEQVKAILNDNGIKFQQDHGLVRGLDYYTNTAFEILVPGIGAQSAIGGGGRYNGLVSASGGPDIPGVGFALGLERLLLALEQAGTPIEDPREKMIFVVAMSEQFEPEAMRFISRLRKAGLQADKDYLARSVKAQMKYADKLKAPLVVFIGESEVAEAYYTVKRMDRGSQEKINQVTAVSDLKKMMES